MRAQNSISHRDLFSSTVAWRTVTSRTMIWLTVLSCCALATPVPAQLSPITGQIQIEVTSQKGQKPTTGGELSNVVVWLTPLDPGVALTSAPPATAPRLVQRNKTFEPHLLVVVAGTSVAFPNEDPYLHNVFSLFDGKRFDLGFYEAGSSRTVRFDRVGVSFLFCNIHPEMSAVVVAVPTAYYGVSDRAGRVMIPNVPDGRYRMEVWAERSLPESLKTLERTVVVSVSERSLPEIKVIENPTFTPDHKNKFGQDYIPPAGSSY
jgi:plastocyanin